MGETHLCSCTFRQCCDVVDPKTGMQGKPLSSKDFRRHQRDELHVQRKILEQQAREAQQSAIKAQEESIARALTRVKLTESPPSRILPTEVKYKVDQKRALLRTISGHHEQIIKLLDNLESIGIPDEMHPLPSGSIQQALSRLQEIRVSWGQIATHLDIIAVGKLRKEQSVAIVLQEAQAGLSDLLSRINEVEAMWSPAKKLEEEAINTEAIYDSAKYFQGIFGDSPEVVQLTCLMVVACHVIFGLPRRACLWLFSMCSFIIETTVYQASTTNESITSYFANIIHNFPKDVRTASSSFRLEAGSTIYAVCPKCHETYKPNGDKEWASYPERCNSTRYSNRCGELMLRPKKLLGHVILVPIKPYVVFDMVGWLAGLMSRQGYEELMDKAWDRAKQNSGGMDDIFQGSVIREFRGPDGETLFRDAGPDKDTGRYLFSMGFDFFNPLRTMANGKRISIGVVAMICLNLPINMRYKPENIFLAGIIPGPKEPSLDAINPYIRPFIEVLLKFWSGIKFTKTALYEGGRWILCALVAIICDLPAARKIGGFSSCNHEYFCSICWCSKSQHKYDDYQYNSWVRRTNESCRQWAEAFRTADSERKARRSFDQSGLRYSVLLELPYFDPTKHLVVDPMHNLFLGLIKEHFQNILGYLPKGVRAQAKLTSPVTDVKLVISPTIANALPENLAERKSVRRLITYLETHLTFTRSDQLSFDATVKKWSAVHRSALVYVGKGLDCVPHTVQANGHDSLPLFGKVLNKKELATSLLEWKMQQTLANVPNERHNTGGRMFHEDEIEVLWEDIRNMVKPSWATSVPDNISSSGAKLKSDQWRSIGTLYLPVTLIHMWSKHVEDSGNETDNPSRAELLHLTMLLCSAVSLVTSRTVNQRNAELYLNYMTEYRKELQRLFPGYICHPNHHMAMHVAEFVHMYGPVHGWWTFPFERLIGNLQRIRTNYKSGEYEVTIGRSWTRSSNLRSLFSKQICPPAIKYCFDMFNMLTLTQNRNALAEGQEEDPEELDDEGCSPEKGSSPSLTALPVAFRQAIQRAQPLATIPTSAVTKSRFTAQGVSYTLRSIHEGNSGILCKGSNIPYSIDSILEFPNGIGLEQYWFIVKRHCPAEVMVDPYANYPYIRAKLWRDDLQDVVEAIPLSQVETHFAKCGIIWEDKSVVVIVSLSKVQIM